MDSRERELFQIAWDVVIVGGGPASSCAAIELAKHDKKVLVIEQHADPKVRFGESLPPSAVSIARQLLGDIQAEDFAKMGLRPGMGNQSCWTEAQPQLFDFSSHPSGHGFCIDRRKFDKALQQQAVAEGAYIVSNARFQSCSRIAEPDLNWQLCVELLDTATPQSLKTTFLVDATGRKAVVARALGLKVHRFDKLVAFAQYYQQPESGLDVSLYTELEACPQGWWYSNLMPDAKTRVVVFHTDRDLAQAKTASGANGFTALLKQTQLIASRLSDYEYIQSGPIQAAAAGSQCLDAFTARHFLAIGDAAQAYDPLSSQGVMKALRSGVMAGQLISYALIDSGKSQTYLDRYAQEQSNLWRAYQHEYHYYYQTQPRWTYEAFWSRRQNSAFAPPAENLRIAQ